MRCNPEQSMGPETAVEKYSTIQQLKKSKCETQPMTYPGLEFNDTFLYAIDFKAYVLVYTTI